MWTVDHPRLTGAELFELDESGEDVALRGWVVAALDGVECALQYEVKADAQWRTRRVEITILSEGNRTHTIEHDGRGNWLVDGSDRPELSTCLDIDLGITPSTNTLPIRRLGLGVGETGHLDAAWVRFPDLSVEVLGQSYERVSQSLYRYSSNDFQRDVVVDEQAVVLRYGDDLWQAIPG